MPKRGETHVVSNHNSRSNRIFKLSTILGVSIWVLVVSISSIYYGWAISIGSILLGTTTLMGSIGGLNKINNFLAKTHVSLGIIVVVESLQLLIDRALELKKDPIKKEPLIIDPYVQNYVLPIVKKYEIEVGYLSQYVLPSYVFTAIFQIGGNTVGLFNTVSESKKVMVRGLLKACASVSVSVLSKLQKKDGDVIKAHDLVIPFSKEPIVSVCKLMLFDQGYVQKFSCNLVGEASHNVAKFVFGTQKLSLAEVSLTVLVKPLWKTAHQHVEGTIVKDSGNPLGFYLASSVARSYGNKFIEDSIVEGINIDFTNLNTSLSNHPGNIAYVATTCALWGITSRVMEIQDLDSFH